jgi:hypothetical protein
VIDAHPEDINKIDYIKPDGTPVMRTIADYRQLNDALFHAGLNSGSQFEWIDEPNRLHFYIIDLQKNAEGILTYKIGVRSLDGQPAGKSRLTLVAPASKKRISSSEYYTFLVSAGSAEDVFSADYDIYRVSAKVEGGGWNTQLLNSLVSLKSGDKGKIAVFISRDKSSSGSAKVTLTLRSESDPAKVVVSTFMVQATTN